MFTVPADIWVCANSIGAPRLGDRILLALLLLGGLSRRDQRALDIAERGEHRLVVGRQQLGIARLADRPPGRAARRRGKWAASGPAETAYTRFGGIDQRGQRRALVAARRRELDARETARRGRP